MCCDGAYPFTRYVLECEPEVFWRGGHCTSQQGIGQALTVFRFAEAVPERLGENTIVRVVADGEPQPAVLARGVESVEAALPYAAEVVLEVVNLATGEIVRSEPAWSDGGPDHEGFGVITEHDIHADLATTCEGPAYVCNVGDDEQSGPGWEPEACEPFATMSDESSDSTSDEPTNTLDDDGSSSSTASADGADVSTHGCACRSTPEPPGTPSFAAFALLGLGALHRRRWRAPGHR